MSELENPGDELGDEVVAAPELEEGAEATEEVEGQEETPPEGEEAEAEEAEVEKPDEDSPSKKRRERRKAHLEELKARAQAAEDDKARIVEAGKSLSPPKEDDFEDYSAYQAATAYFTLRQQERQAETGIVDKRLQEAHRQVQGETDAIFMAQVQEATEKYENYQAVAFGNFPVNDTMSTVIKSMDQGADVLYHLGSNPATAVKIASLSPIEAAVELGRIEASLKPPEPRRGTKAPVPIKPVRGKSPAARDPAKMSPDEYRAWRQSGGSF